MVKLFYVWFLLKVSICGCSVEKKHNNFHKVNSNFDTRKVGRLPQLISESSGLAFASKINTYWTMNDSGGGAEIYEINESGNLIRAKKLQNLINRDWEDLTSDPGGALYIGDIGNNGNSRDSLRIYILNPDLDLTGTINYSYEPSEGNRSGRENSEAFFFYDDSLYFFSKSNEIKGGSVRLYRLPAKPGNYQAEFIDEITINGQVTSADVSPDKQEFVLLTYGKLLFFDIKEGKIDFQLPSGCLKMANKQAEAILYLDSKQLLVTNEQRDIFRLSEKNKK